MNEQIILAHVNAKTRLFNFVAVSGNIYNRTTDHYVVSLKKNNVEQAQVSSSTVSEDEYYYDVTTKTLYIWSDALSTDVFIVTYRLFFSNAPINYYCDFENNLSESVYYEPRITANPNFKTEISPEQFGISLVGNGKIDLLNTDAYFKNIFSKYIWENQEVSVYLINRNDAPSEAQILYRGLITTKTYDYKKVSFALKDFLKFANNKVSLSRYTSTDTDSLDLIDTYKRRVFGKVERMKLSNLDPMGESVTLSGTISISGTAVTGSSTSFFTELTPDDSLIVENIEYNIESIESDTALTLSEAPSVIYTDETLTAKLNTASPLYNREWQISEKILSEASTTLVEQYTAYHIKLTSASNLKAGDYILVSSEYKQIENVSTNNIIKLVTALENTYPTDTIITRSPIQAVYINNTLISPNYYDVSNTASGCIIELDYDIEFQIANTKTVYSSNTYTITNGTNYIVESTSNGGNLSDKIKSRDYVKLGSNDWIEVLNVEEDKIYLRETITTGYSGTLYVKSTSILEDDSNINCTCYGETENNVSSGALITTASQAIYKLLSEVIDSDYIDATSFVGNADLELISLIIGEKGASEAPKLTEIINKLNQSVFGTLLLDENLKIAYHVFDTSYDVENLPSISKYDCIDIKVENLNIIPIQNINTKYRLSEGNESFELYEYENDFVADYIESNETQDITLNLYNQSEAEYNAAKKAKLTELNGQKYVLEIPLNSFTDIKIGDIYLLDLGLFENSFSGKDALVAFCGGIEKTSNKKILSFYNFGDLLIRRLILAPDTISDYDVVGDDEKLLYSFIPDENGLINDSEDTFNNNIIF